VRNQPTNNVRDEWDDATLTYRGYDQFDKLVETRPYTPDEVTDLQQETNRKSLQDQALVALQSNLDDIARNDAAIAVAAPTNAQVISQMKELSRQSSRQAKQINALIRLALGKLDSTD
jgi:uncharacterized protein with WD repeat